MLLIKLASVLFCSNDKILSLPASAWSPTLLIFEAEGSYLGRKVGHRQVVC